MAGIGANRGREVNGSRPIHGRPDARSPTISCRRDYSTSVADDSRSLIDTVRLPEGAEALFQKAAPSETPRTLLVFHGGGVRRVELASGESVTIGRDAPADVVIDDRSLSRQHARFTRHGQDIDFEDLGSTNGTVLEGRRVDRGVLPPGALVRLGSVAVTHHPHALADAAGVDGDDRFRRAVGDELRRARHFGRGLSLVMIRAAGSGAAASWAARMRPLLAPVDHLALYGSDAVTVLAPETATPAAHALAEKLLAAAAAPDVAACAGVATYPGPAGTVDGLLEAVRAAALAAPAGSVAMASGAATRALPPDNGGAPAPVVESAALAAVFRMVDRLATSVVPVLLFGETGSGKEVVARAIHGRGPRHAAPLVCVNCGAIPAQLVESTLFGHERGAFTGALQQHRGVFEAAQGGTVFLDEVGELPAPAQAALLRVLESRRLIRVGSTREVEVDARVVAATHRDLGAMVAAGTFREDLFYRLDVVSLTVPPLRQRVAEIEPLALRFLKEASASNRRDVERIDGVALALMKRYAWPGNVRELRNVVDRAVIVADGDTVTVADLPERLRDGIAAPAESPATRAAPSGTASGPAPASTVTGATAGDAAGDLKAQLAAAEAAIILEALRVAGGNQSEAARALKMPLRTLVFKIKRYGIRKLGYDVG
jgi:DNA-binding NtrC family response regulator/pSer/pThr/pTyr-binding forkhead associated (FHA) protein